MSRHPVQHGVPDVDAVAATATYRELIERLKQRIRESQARAARTVNTELVMLYWSIGRDILDQQQAGGWGDDIVGRIAQDLATYIGSPRGFSRRNLFYMRRFATMWLDPEKVQTLSAPSDFSGQMYEMGIHYVAPIGRLRIRTVRDWGRDRYSNP